MRLWFLLCTELVTPQAVWILFSPMASGWTGRWSGELVAGKNCLGHISETVRCNMFILGRDIGWDCRCVISWRNLDLTFDLAVVTLTYKILSWMYLGNCKV